MGALHSLYASPPVGSRLTKAQFVQVLIDVGEIRFLLLPCALFRGSLSVRPVDLWLKYKPYYHGSSLDELIESLNTCRYGEEDIAVWFDGFNWSNEEFAQPFAKEGVLGFDSATFYALSEPKPVEIEEWILREGTLAEFDISSFEIHLQHYFCAFGETLGVPFIRGTLLDEFFLKHFGDGYQDYLSFHGPG